MNIFQTPKRAASVIEYVVLFVMFLTAIFLMQKHIARALFGRWRDLGDSFGQGEQYNPSTTLECGRYVPHTTTGWGSEIWYLQECYKCCMDTNEECPDFSGDEAVCRAKDTALKQRDCCAQGCEDSDCAN
jgi:hypothetical protein